MLGRCRRRVLVCDAGAPRNARAAEIHGLLTRDGIAPDEYLRLAREDLLLYEQVALRCAEVTDATCTEDGFEILCRDGTKFFGRTLLLATGVVDELPTLEGLAPLYGTSVHHCPYCDAWEWRDQPIAVYGRGDSAAGLALSLRQWTADVVLCTDGPDGVPAKERRRLKRRDIIVREERVVRLEGRGGHLEQIVFVTGDPLPRRALFLSMSNHQRSTLASHLGCRMTKKGAIHTVPGEASSIPGVYVAGDASSDVQFVSVAVAEGARAAVAINKRLLQEDLRTP